MKLAALIRGALPEKPPVQELPKGAYGSFDSTASSRIPENEAPHELSALLRQHGGFPGVDWKGLALTDAEQSALWIVQRLDGLLTTLATVDPIPRPRSYRQAWPARFLKPEPTTDEFSHEFPATNAVIDRARQRARQTTWRK